MLKASLILLLSLLRTTAFLCIFFDTTRHRRTNSVALCCDSGPWFFSGVGAVKRTRQPEVQTISGLFRSLTICCLDFIGSIITMSLCLMLYLL